MVELVLDVTFRAHQFREYNNRNRFNVRVWHRRAGKTFYTILDQLIALVQTNRPDYRAFYCAPTFKQAKSISWDYIKSFTKHMPYIEFNEAELRVDFWNGGRYQLLGAEQYDSLRGLYADDIALDEAALIPSAAWEQVFNPMLSDREGRATFMGTPMGRMNLLYDLYQYAANEGDPEWTASLLPYTATQAIKPKEIERMRRTMREEVFAQELECSWNAAIRGAYYMRELAAADAAGRITTVRYDSALPVIAAIDLGWSDTMVASFWQQAGTEHRCLLARGYEQTKIADMIRDWRELSFPVDHVVLPHDAKVTELGTGKTRQEVFNSLGCETSLCPNIDLHEGISQTRDMLAHAWFDYENTKTLREALLAYRSEYDEVKSVHRMTPVHDWSSHWADSARYYAVGRPAAGVAGAWGDNSHLYARMGRSIR
ncbi:MAG: terminase family protein [Amaricoccus sp.]|uniref:terminase large subunit domain-containing protein n=1 Tax=Amaricoccus sp. TaxID=1872485 RepID=UPI0039E2FAEC